ncbi:MAG TPA: PaaI family thioesterase [Acidobacteria bacterium]|nr:PaaI family thioesterase [Acidobacteriota bacterium]
MSTPQGTAPEVVPEPGWEPVKPFRLEGGRGSFVSGDPRGDRLRVSYFRRIDDGLLVGRAWFGPGAQGPPGHAHGGSIAAVLDEAMGAAAWLAGHLVVAVRLDTRFRKMLPLGTDTFLEASLTGVEGRKVHARGRLLSPGGELFAEADGVFVELDAERFRPLLEQAAAARGVSVEELLRAVPGRGPGPG